MGAAWCRERIEQAQNSKSPVDRIITRCSNAINAKNIYTKPNHSKPANDIVFKQIRYANAPPVPVHRVAPPRSHPQKGTKAKSEWQDVALHVPEKEDPGKTPKPPPRMRKKRKINSLEVLNSQLDKIYRESQRRSWDPSRVRMFGDPLPPDEAIDLNLSSSPDKSPVKNSSGESRRKNRAKRIMDSKTRSRKRDTFQPLSLAREFTIDASSDRVPRLTKNVSAVSLPDYEQLSKDRSDSEKEQKDLKRNISTVSLPGDTVLTALSGVTMNRLEAYLRRCRSFGSLKPQQLLEKLEEITNKQDTESSDSWSGLDDWDVGVIEYCDADSSEQVLPKSRLPVKNLAHSDESGPLKDTTPKKQLTDSVPPEDRPLPPTPPVPFYDVPLTDKSHPPHDWFASPVLIIDGRLKTPPPTPEEALDSKGEQRRDSHSALYKILKQYKDETNDENEEPTRPKRRSKDEFKRRQSLEDSKLGQKTNQLMLRSMSLEESVRGEKTWRNLGASSSRHSLQYALSDFLGFRVGENKERDNCDSSLFPSIEGDDEREAETDNETPPPLPTSPPPIL